MPERDKMKGVKPGVQQWKIDKLNKKAQELHYFLAKKFPDDYVLTDGFREANSNVGADASRHLHGDAIDISPNPTVYNYLMNNPEGIQRLNEAGLGIFDETDPRNLRVGTGAHFHIGSDFHHVTKGRLKLAEEHGEDLPKANYFQQQHPDFDYRSFINERNRRKPKGVKHMDKGTFKNFSRDYLVKNVYSKFDVNPDPSKDIYVTYINLTGKTGSGRDPEDLRRELAELPPSEFTIEHDHDHDSESETSGFAVDYVSKENPEYAQIKEQNRLLRQQMEKQQEVDEEKQRKLEEQEELKALREKENEKLSFLEAMTEKPAYVEREQSEPQQQQQQLSSAYRPTPLPQQQMDLPNIWDFSRPQQTLEEGGEVISKHGWDYKKEGDQYFTRREGEDNWIKPQGEALEAIQQKIFGDTRYTQEDKQSEYQTNVQALIDKGRSLEELVEARVGTKEGLLRLFPELTRGEAVSKRPWEMPELPSWREHAATTNEGIKPREITGSELTRGEAVEEAKYSFNNPESVSDQQSLLGEEVVMRGPLGRAVKGQPPQGGIQDALSWYKESAEDKGLNRWEPENRVKLKSWGETDLGHAVSEVGKTIGSATDWGERLLVKEGLVDPLNSGTHIVKNIDTRGEKNKKSTKGFKKFDETEEGFMRYENEFDLQSGQRYMPIANVGKSNSGTKYKNVEGIAHFLLDADLTDGYQHDYAKNNVRAQLSDPKPVMSPGSTVEVAYVPVHNKQKDGTVVVTYKPQTEIMSSTKPVVGPGGAIVRDSYEGTAENVKSILRQYRFTDLDWEGDGTPGGVDNSFKNTIAGLKTVSGETTNLIYPNTEDGKKAYGKFGGASVVFIVPESGIAVDFAGSVEDIKKKGVELADRYGIPKEDVIVGFHDIGSFSAKPAANEKGELNFSQWKGFNPRSHVGGGLAIIKD